MTIKDKIFDEDVIEYITDLGINTDSIDKLQKKKVKEHSISVLKEIIKAIEENDFSSIKKYLVYSPAGDCMGYNNTFINFGEVTGSNMDIEDLAYYLTNERLDIKF
jgi:hypothetical protein